MEFNYSKLRGKICEVCGTRENFADALGISRQSLSRKINNKTEFTQPEIFRAMDILGLQSDEMSAYFFTPLVQISEPKKEESA